jgi:RimJ/RimL family protein N-acetyltransferase
VVPSLDYNILLTADTEVILARKRELDEAGIRAINEAIDYLKDKPGYLKVENNGAPQEAVAKILNYVFEQQHKKNLKRLK